METMVGSAIKKSKLTELMRFKEKGSKAKIYVKTNGNKDTVSEVLMYMSGAGELTEGFAESIIVSLTGVININKLSKLADTFAKTNK